MRTGYCVAAMAMAAGCGTNEPRPEVEAVRDMVALEAPRQVDQIRLEDQLNFGYVNDYYVEVVERDRHYLVEFRSRCWALRSRVFRPSMIDTRRNPYTLNSRGDTILGCFVDRIYLVTQAQMEEILELQQSYASGGP